MAFLDRDYYRSEGSGPFVAWLQNGLITKILVVASILVYVIQISTDRLVVGQSELAPGEVTTTLGLIGVNVLHGQLWRLLTFSFLHTTSSLLPFLFDIPLFWVVGHELEHRLGRKQYGIFLTLASLCAGLAVVAAERAGLGGQASVSAPVVGCSAVIAAMLIWLILETPRLKLTFFYSLTVPAWVLLAASLVMDAWGLVQLNDGRRFTLVSDFGALLFTIIYQGTKRATWRSSLSRRSRAPLSDPDLRIFREESNLPDQEEMPAPVPSDSDMDEHLEAQLDAVLAKVAERGQDSLTSAERAILNRASEVYRRRRR
jgi:membrane associated rhomboid family serine protease